MSDDLKKAIISTMSDMLAAHLDAQQEIHIQDITYKVMVLKQEALAAHFSHVEKVQREILSVASDASIALHCAAQEIVLSLFSASSLSEDDKNKISDVVSNVFERLSQNILKSLHDTVSKAQDSSMD